MPKLHLKRTAAEEAERAWKKAKRAARKEAKSKRARVEDEDLRTYDAGYSIPRDERSKHSDPGPSEHLSHFDDDDYEERRFQEKMRDAMEDDGRYDASQRLDGVSAHLESYAHVPRRWRGVGQDEWMGDLMAEGESGVRLEPWQMNDDEYAEWIRVGMWKRKHRAELEADALAEAQRAAKKEYERKVREETRKLEREAEMARKERKSRDSRKRFAEEREKYETKWQVLGDRSNTHSESASKDDFLAFDDIPWPIFMDVKKGKATLLLPDDITANAVSSFLLSADTSYHVDGPLPEQTKEEREKLILRTTMLRYHPDKFESRLLQRIREEDRETAKAVANAVVRVVGELMRKNG